MAFYTYDTSFIISNKLSELPDNFLLSAVVLMELTASAPDEATRKQFESLRRVYEKDDTLIVPNSDDWLLASRILYWLEHGRKRSSGGKSPRKKTGATQTMALDALIAVSSRRYDATVVTENWEDFKTIQYYCKFKLMKGSDFLRQ
jgi:predicted nucleic acid-binding protein